MTVTIRMSAERYRIGRRGVGDPLHQRRTGCGQAVMGVGIGIDRNFPFFDPPLSIGVPFLASTTGGADRRRCLRTSCLRGTSAAPLVR